MSYQWEREVAEVKKAYDEENEAEHRRLVRAMSEALARSGALAPAPCSAFTRGLWRAPFRYEAEGTMVVDARGERILDVRGWGYLTGTGSGALGLSEEKAAAAQDEIGASVAAMLTALWQNR